MSATMPFAEFSKWECYMLVKYGNTNSFGSTGRNKSEYLIELPIYPESVQESISSDWTEQKVIGRSSPLAAFSGTSLKSVSFNMELHRELLTGSHSLTTGELNSIKGGSLARQTAGVQKDFGAGFNGGRDWYVSVNKMLQMSCYSQYTDYGSIPPTTYFVFGQMILKGYVETFSTHWKKPILNTFYGWNDVSISMKCYPDTIITADDVLTKNSSTQNTYNTTFPSKGSESSDVTSWNFGRPNSRSAGNRLGCQVMYT